MAIANPELTLLHAPTLAAELRERVAVGAPVEVDLSQVVEMDTAGLQVLLAAQQEARARGLPFRLQRPSVAARAVLDTLGLSARLMPGGDGT